MIPLVFSLIACKMSIRACHEKRPPRLCISFDDKYQRGRENRDANAEQSNEDDRASAHNETHAFWLGMEIHLYVPNCVPFPLRRGFCCDNKSLPNLPTASYVNTSSRAS